MNYELSSSQKTFSKNVFDTMWNHGVIYFFKKTYSYEQLNDAINSLLKTFESLRLHSKEEKVFLEKYYHYNYPFYSFSNKESLYAFANEFINNPFNKNEILARFAVFEMQGQSGILSCAHHLSIDGYSSVLAINHINNHLKHISEKDTIRQPYEEYIQNEKKYQTSKRYIKDRCFWFKQIDLFSDCSVFKGKKAFFDYSSDEVNCNIQIKLFNRIEAFCIDNDISMQSFFNTVYSAYVYRTFEMNSFRLGVPVLNRTTEVEFNSGGLYMHILPMLVNISDETFLQTALNVEDAQMTLFRHQKFTQHDIKELLKEEGKPQNTLFDIATDYQEFEENEDYEFEFIYSNSLSVPLEIHMQSFGKKKHNLKIRYRTSMFSEKEIHTMMRSFIAIIEDVLDNHDKKISELEMLSAEEKQKVLYDFNNTSVSYAKDKSIHELFEEQAEKTPDKVAVVASDKSLTYKELNEEANRIAHSLIEKRIDKGDIVGLMLPKKSYLLSALFGILKTGAAYLPIDSELPTERIEYMLSDSGAKFCITEDSISELMKNENTENPKYPVDEDTICYCIYTSGSTGKAKGTLIYHRNLVWYMSSLKSIYGTDNINMPVFTSQSVDLTVTSLFFPLLNGGTVYLYNGELKENLVKIFSNDKLSIIKLTPTHIDIICNLLPDKQSLNLRNIIVGGEALYRKSCVEFLNKFGDHIKIHNEYGPTEATVGCMDYVFDENITDNSVPIGQPLDNVQIYIVDKYNKPVPIGVTGEICIAGDGVGGGYLNNPELTAEKFIDNPFGEGKLYKTGDLAYWGEDGNIVYVGRSDFQVKIRGLRIELGEIENTIRSIDGVVQCAVVVRKDEEGRQYICAFYTGEEISTKELREEIGKSLPKYMVPHIFTYIEEMPLTSSGKIDRNNLPSVNLNSNLSEAEYVAPTTAEEKAFANAVTEILSVEKVSMLEGFFDIGGDSIKAIYIVSELEEMGYELHVADIMQKETLSDIAKTMKPMSDKAVYDQNEVRGIVPFSPIMRAFLKESNTIPEDYVHTGIITVDCDEETARKAVDALVSHHDMLRGDFCDNGIRISLSKERESYSYRTIIIDDIDRAREYLNNTNIDSDKLVNVIFCRTKKENLVSITVHHFLIDLVSWEVVIKDFRTAVEQIENDEEVSLPAKTASFMMWSDELKKYSETISEESKEYWKNINRKLDNAKTLSPNTEENEAENFSFTFDKAACDKLNNGVNYTYGTRTNEVLLTALGLAASKIAGGAVGVMVESHGRAELQKAIALERTVGWFTSCYPVVINGNSDITGELINTKETLRKIPRNGIDYLLLSEGFHKNTDILFNYYKTDLAVGNVEEQKIGFSGNSVFPGKINVSCLVVDNVLTVNISVAAGNHKKQICEELGREFIKQLEKIIDVCSATDTVVKTCSDFSDGELTETELKELKEIFDERTIEDIYSLTPMQEGIYAQYFQNRETKTYQLHNLNRISKEADLDVLKKSVELLSLRHRVIKTAFPVLKSTGAIKQVILENRKPEFSILQQAELFSQNALDKIIGENLQKPLDLQRDSLFRITVVDFTDERFMLVHMHHIITDGWCLPILISDLQKYYEKLLKGISTEELTDEINREVLSNTSYAQYVRWIRNQNENDFSEYWRNLLTNCYPAHIFGKEKKGKIKNEDMVTFEMPLSNELTRYIEQFASKNKVSHNTVFESAFGIALQKYSGSEEVVFDKIISGRSIPLKNIENTVGPFINTVPVRLKCDGSSALSDVLKEIQNQTVNANKYGVLPLSEIYKLCNIDSKSIDSLFVFENYFTGDISDIEKGPLSLKVVSFEEQTEFNLTVTVLKENNKYTVRASYSEDVYTEREMKDFLNGYISVLSKLDDSNYIKDISVADMKLIESFNNTSTEYRKDKSIYELFEEQAERTPDKVAVIASDKSLTYKDLNEEANRIAHSLMEKGIGKGDIVGLMLPRKSYLLAALFGILKTGAAYLPIDPDYPEDRIEYMLSDSSAKLCITQENINELLNNTNTGNLNVNMSSEGICYCIYTSGSTGKPKGTLLTHRNVANYVVANEKNVFYGIIGKDTDSILSVTTVGFDIFVTESILPVVNGIKVILADENQAKLQSKLSELIKKYPADVLQTTPTKMKSLTADERELEYLKKFKVIILGGETLDISLVKKLKEITDAKIFNIYGPTETTVWVTNAEITDTDITIGKPMANAQVHILDKHLKPVPIGVTGELCIAGDSVSAGYLNRPELTAEKFIDNPFGEGKLYKTGDLAYWQEDGNIVYVGRSDFQVKIRGLRIELGEIENTIRSIDGVVQCAVVVRKDKEGRQLICAFYTGEEISAKELREEIGKRLPKYMVPHIFTYLSEMPMTSSGKVNRNALPEIDLENIGTETEYIAPETEQEKVLTECVEDVLGAERVSVLDNFFDMGGDSLKAIELTARLEEKGYTVAIKTIFSCKDIQELAGKLDEKEAEEIKIEYGSVIPATPAQMRVYTAQMMSPDSTMYNVTYAFRTQVLDKEQLEKAVNKLIARHESLRTRFENRNGQIVQIIEEKAEISVESIGDINEFAQPFNLNSSPLIRVGCTEETVVVSLHHIIVDGESIPVFFRELNELYMDRELSDTVQYGEFAVTDSYREENEKYWLSVFEEEVPPLELPSDYPRAAVQSFRGSNIYEQINIALHKKIEEKCKEKGITPYVYYMACFSILLSKLSGVEDIVVGTPMSGRQSRYFDTIGMFVNTIALRSRPEGNKRISDLLDEIRDGSIEAIDNQNYPFGELVRKLNIEVGGRNPLYDVMLAYQSYEMTDITFGDEKAELIPLTTTDAKCDITFNILPRENDVVLAAEYCTDLFREERIKKIAGMYVQLLEKCLDEQEYIKDISVTDMKLIDSFNNTAHTYNIPESSTLYSLFEKTAKENSDKICIRTAEKNLTFGELLNVSEGLDSEIRKLTGGEKSVIAVIAERSVEMYAAIYGIIRSGNAYLPIDPDYPQERIEYILRNSEAKAVLTQGRFSHLAGQVPHIDVSRFISTPVIDCTDVPSAATQDDTAYVIYTSGSTGNPKGAKVSHKSAVNRILWMHDKYPLGAEDVILQKTPYTFDVSVWEHFWWGICGGSLAVSKPGEHFLPAKILEETSKNKVTHLHFVPSVFELFLNYLESHREEVPKFSTVKYVFLSGEALTSNLIQRFYRLYDYNKVTVHNLYGPTECAVDVTYYDCVPQDTDPVPIGKPIYNTQMYVVDKYNKPVPIGVTGELCIAGMNVGQGYLNNPELTAEKFIDNPFGEGKLYKTGDLAYWREDGNIIFCGRKDSQIKLNGQRIETGEIEAVISSLDEVESVAVLVRKSNQRDILVAFYSGQSVSEDTIKDVCRSKLPKYMVPSFAVHLESMPLNQNGKLDRKILAQMEIDASEAEVIEEPISDTEKYICRVFEEILGEKNIGRNSDFFEMGGTSYSMISLLSEEGFENISAADFMRNPTPAMLAEMLSKNSLSKSEYLEELYLPEKAKKALIVLPFAGGGAEAFSNFVVSLKKERNDIAVYFIRYLHSIEECENAANEIAALLKDKEIVFYSHCVGSAVALQIISQLEMHNITVEHYFAGASIPPANPTSKNIWNYVLDRILKKILLKAGANFGNLSDEKIALFLKNFRKDTDFAGVAFSALTDRIKTPTSVVLSKKDMFTKNYSQAGVLWANFSDKSINMSFIDSKTHYFQKDNSDELVDIILKTI